MKQRKLLSSNTTGLLPLSTHYINTKEPNDFSYYHYYYYNDTLLLTIIISPIYSESLISIADSKVDRSVDIRKIGKGSREETICSVKFKCEFQEWFKFEIKFQNWELTYNKEELEQNVCSKRYSIYISIV